MLSDRGENYIRLQSMRHLLGNMEEKDDLEPNLVESPCRGPEGRTAVVKGTWNNQSGKGSGNIYR